MKAQRATLALSVALASLPAWALEGLAVHLDSAVHEIEARPLAAAR